MKFLFTSFLFLLIVNPSFSQDSTKMRITGGAENRELQSMMSFEGIALDKFEFTGKQLVGKDFDFKVKEFKNGKLVHNSNYGQQRR